MGCLFDVYVYEKISLFESTADYTTFVNFVQNIFSWYMRMIIYVLVRIERLPEPTFVIDSGQGLYAVWLIESVPAKFKSVQKLYNHIEKYLIEVLKDFGSDTQASDIARVLKALSTYNNKTGKIVKVLRYNEKRNTNNAFYAAVV